MYLLLMKFITPGGDKLDWRLLFTLDEAKQELMRHEKETERYQKLSPMLVVVPLLIEGRILKVEVVQ